MQPHVDPVAVLLIIAMHLVIAASFIAPEASLNLWHKIQGFPKHYREKRLEKKSRELEERLRKCWLIDLRKTR